jgi:hypothetical protein
MPYVLVGGLCGLAWAAGFRGWMAQLVGAESSYSWLTVVLVLLPGTAIGLLLAPLVLPFAGFTTTGLPAVPEPAIVVPWMALAPLYLTSIGLVLVVALLVARRMPRTSLTDTLRGREGAA